MNAPHLQTNPLTEAQMRHIAPSIFQTEPHGSRSKHYQPVPTIALLKGLETEGWVPFNVQQGKVRDPDQAEYTKHLVRLRHKSQTALARGTEFNELVMTNSFDGTSSFELMAGRFRVLCLNGMVVGKTFESMRLHHRGNIVDNVIEGATRIIEEFEEVNAHRDEMAAIKLDDGAALAFAQGALAMRYPGQDNYPISAESLLVRRRPEDLQPDLWSTFNTVQENLIRGGIRGRAASGRRMMTRGISGIAQDVGLNRLLWDLADFSRRLANGEVHADEVDMATA